VEYLFVRPDEVRAIAHGFSLTCPDDQEKLKHEFPMYDALYAWCQQRVKQ